MLVSLASCLGKNQMENTVIQQADELGSALKNRRIEKYLDYMAHFVFNGQAERQELKQKIEDQFNYLAERKTRIVRVQNFLHSEIVENEDYYQCVIKQVVFNQNEHAMYDANTYFLAISKDGETWKFADVTAFTENIIRQVFPQLAPELKFNNNDR